MTQFIQAVYEHGVFRPLQPVRLPEHEQVSLAVSPAEVSMPAEPSHVARTLDAVELQRQSEALAKLRAEMDALPVQAPEDGLGGADHDLILYGWQK